MEIAGIATFLAAGLLVVSLFVKDLDAQRKVRFAAAGCLIAAGVWVVIVMAPTLF